MKIVLKKNNATLLNAAFIFWLVCELTFNYTMISRIALMLFVGLAILLSGRIRWSAQLTGYGLVILWSLINIVTGHAISKSIATEMTQTLALNLVFLYAFVCYCRYIGDIRTVLNIFKWVSVLFCIICLVGGLGGVFLNQRLSILDINSNRIAKMLAYAVLIIFYEMFNTPKQNWRLKDWLLVALLLGTILLTGSRKGLLVPIIGLYVMTCVQRPGKVVRTSLAVVAATAVVLLLVLNVEFLYNVIGYRIEPVLQYLQAEEYEEASLATRVDFISLGWAESQNGLLFGHGLDCFRLLRYAHNTYSHCNFVELLYSLGMVGVLVYYIPFVYCIVNMRKYCCDHRSLIGIMAAWMVPFLICDYVNVTYFDRISLLIPAMVMVTVSKKGLAYDN